MRVIGVWISEARATTGAAMDTAGEAGGEAGEGLQMRDAAVESATIC